MPRDCPFCGARTELVHTTFGDNPCEYYRVQCVGPKQHCLDYWDDTEFEAIDTWNEVPSAPTIGTQLTPAILTLLEGTDEDNERAEVEFEKWRATQPPVKTRKLTLGLSSTAVLNVKDSW